MGFWHSFPVLKTLLGFLGDGVALWNKVCSGDWEGGGVSDGFWRFHEETTASTDVRR